MCNFDQCYGIVSGASYLGVEAANPQSLAFKSVVWYPNFDPYPFGPLTGNVCWSQEL